MKKVLTKWRKYGLEGGHFALSAFEKIKELQVCFLSIWQVIDLFSLSRKLASTVSALSQLTVASLEISPRSRNDFSGSYFPEANVGRSRDEYDMCTRSY